MAVLNFDPLVGSGYMHHNTRTVGPRVVARYILEDSRSAETIDRAARAIIQLLAVNPHLHPVFPTEPGDTLVQTVRDNPYLVVNGRAVCLSLHPGAPADVLPQFIDKFFSEAVLENPVRCEADHLLEGRFVEQWVVRFPNLCPVEARGPHRIGPLRVDPEAQEDVNRFRTAQQQEEEKNSRLEASVFQAQLLHADTQRTLAQHRHERGIELSGAVAKIVTKTGIHVFLNGAKFGEKILFKGACESCRQTFKRLPVLSLFIGLGLGIYQCFQGEYYRAAGEVASGAIACVPGWGTAGSIALDLVMASYDIYETCEGVQVDMSIEKAHATLQLPPPDPAHPPTADQIHAAIRNMARVTHPDTLRRLGEYYEGAGEELQTWINGCGDLLLRHYGYA